MSRNLKPDDPDPLWQADLGRALQILGGLDSQEAERVLPLVYAELHREASRRLRQDMRGHPVQATEIVLEAFRRLDRQGFQWSSRTHFFAVVARFVRRILVEKARVQIHGQNREPTALTLLGRANRASDVLALDDALSSLEAIDPRQATVVELHFFAGLTLGEVASQLGLSKATVSREWQTAKLWLHRELSGVEVFSDKNELSRGSDPIEESFLDVSPQNSRAEVTTEPSRKKSEPLNREAVEERQAKRLERARRAFLKEFGSPGEAATNDIERWEQQGQILTVTHKGRAYVPSFQFDEKGHPRPAVAKVIQILGKDTSDWGVALWFTAANGWLDGKRPVDLLKDEPEEVIQAAEQEAAELVF